MRCCARGQVIEMPSRVQIEIEVMEFGSADKRVQFRKGFFAALRLVSLCECHTLVQRFIRFSMKRRKVPFGRENHSGRVNGRELQVETIGHVMQPLVFPRLPCCSQELYYVASRSSSCSAGDRCGPHSPITIFLVGARAVVGWSTGEFDMRNVE